MHTDSHYFPPWKQAAIVLGGAIVVQSIFALYKLGAGEGTDVLFPWSVATALQLFFAIWNSLSSLRAPSFQKHWTPSMISFAALAVLNGSMAWLNSGLSIQEAGSYKFIFLVVAFGFMVFLSIVNLAKKVIHFAENEQWDEPRRKKK